MLGAPHRRTTDAEASLCLLIGPILLAFVNYLVAGWLVMAVGKRVRVFCFMVTAPNIAKIFLSSDLLCLFLQGAGGALLSEGTETFTSLGNATVLAGLGVVRRRSATERAPGR